MSRDRRRMFARLGLSTCVALMLGLASAASASAAATIGHQIQGSDSPVFCLNGQDDNTEFIQPTVTSGPGYVVPAGGVAITSWSLGAISDPNQRVKLKVWRKVGEPATYQVVAHDGPRTLVGGVNTFPVNVAVQPGDLIGMTVVLGSADTVCMVDSPGNSVITPDVFGDFDDGQTAAFNPSNPFPDATLNLSAIVALKASNEFEITKVKKNKNRGTAVLTVDVPGPGQLSLTGKGVKTQRAGATISKDVDAAGKATLKVKAKGAKKQKLLSTGKVKVKAKVTFKPSAGGGADLPGDPNTEPKKIKLIDK